jgi:hypothetical protein
MGGSMERKTVQKENVALENLVIFMILLVLVQTVLEEVAILMDWPVSWRNILIFTGFGFDVFFTFEFVIRLGFARKPMDYFLRERGWLDFLASVPLLIFNSGILFVTLIWYPDYVIESQVGGFSLLKLVKAIRIARIFRLLRILKAFRRIKYADSPMAQRHLTKILATAISTFILFYFFAQSFVGVIGAPSFEQTIKTSFQDSARQIERLYQDDNFRVSDGILLDNHNLVLINEYTSTRDDNNKEVLTLKNTWYSRYSNSDYQNKWTPSNTHTIRNTEVLDSLGEPLRIYFFSLKPLQMEQSVNSLILFALIIALIVIFMLSYSPHFALTVTDPINVMKRGFEEQDFNYEVAIPKGYRKDEIFKLAKGYNEDYLPMKDRKAREEGGSVIDINSLKDLL